MIKFLKRHKIVLSFIVLSFLCWWRLLVLKGIWWDDWAWVWHFFATTSLSEFMVPFKSLRHELVGYLLYLNVRLLDIFPYAAMNIWNIWKFIIFFINAVLIYRISKMVLLRESILPETIAVTFLVSPVVNNLSLTVLPYQVFLFIFLLSAFFSIKAVDKDKLNVIYYFSAISLSAVSMLGLESFIFFDISRAALIFYIFYKKNKQSPVTAFKRTIFYWMPFVIVGVFILLYKIGVFIPRSGSYAHDYDLYSLPFIKYAVKVVYLYASSLFYIFAGNVIYFLKKLSVAGNISITLSLSFVAALFVILAVLNKSKIVRKNNEAIDFLNEARFTALFGIFLMLVGLFPYLMVSGDYGAAFGVNSRRALLGNIGFSVFIPSILIFLYYNGAIRRGLYYFLFGGFVFLGVFQCNAAVQAYNSDWQQQRSLWWQFIWRVPDIKDKTYLLIDIQRNSKDYLGSWNGSYEFSAPLNLLYAKSIDSDKISKHFSESFENAFDTKVTWSYLNTIGREEAELSYHNGIQKFYPRNLIIASCYKDYLYLNNDIEKSNSGRIVNIDPLLANISPHQVIYKTDDAVYPLRRMIIGPEPKKMDERSFADKVKERILGSEIIRDWRYYLQAARVKDYRNDYTGVVALYKEAERFKVIPEFPAVIPLFIVKSFYMTDKIGEANSLLWQWAFSSDGDLKKACHLLDSVQAAKDGSESSAAIGREIKHIWGTDYDKGY